LLFAPRKVGVKVKGVFLRGVPFAERKATINAGLSIVAFRSAKSAIPPVHNKTQQDTTRTPPFAERKETLQQSDALAVAQLLQQTFADFFNQGVHFRLGFHFPVLQAQIDGYERVL
jgi:hypothetical protein